MVVVVQVARNHIGVLGILLAFSGYGRDGLCIYPELGVFMRDLE